MHFAPSTMAPLLRTRASCLTLMMFMFLPSHALGFACPRIYINSIASTRMSMSDGDGEHGVTRAEFLSNIMVGSLLSLAPGVANSFDGGVGGLGKTRPQTGVVFRDPEAAAATTQSSTGGVSYELIAPDGTPVFLSFTAPYPLLKSTAGIEARDVAGGFESSYVQVVELPRGVAALESVKPALLSQSIFGSTGKFGMYGAPTDIRIKRVSIDGGNMNVYQASFTTLTPAMRESDRKAYISASIVGNALFLLVTSTTAARFNQRDKSLRSVADSFTAISAPKSNLNSRKP